MMLSSILIVALLSTTAFAAPQEKRQATDGAQFTSAANELVSKYLPSNILPALESSVSVAASAASVTGDASSLLYSALLASSIPAWFASAVPAAYTSQIAALEGDISALRGPASTSGSGGLIPVVVAITTTNSAGSTYTTSSTSGIATVTSTTGGVTTTYVHPMITAKISFTDILEQNCNHRIQSRCIRRIEYLLDFDDGGHLRCYIRLQHRGSGRRKCRHKDH
jgi:hypothetical protein